MNDISGVPSTQQVAKVQPQVVRESVQFYSQFKGELAGDLRAPSSGTVYPSEPSEWRERMLAVIGIMDAE